MNKDSTSPIAPPDIKEPDPDAIIWRYMGFDKLQSLIEQKCLTFSCPYLYPDKAEGKYSTINKDIIINKLTNASVSSVENIFHSLHWESEKISYLFAVYASCWHVCDNENMSMWERYSKNGPGIAIQSRYSLLKKSLNESFFIGLINYHKDDVPLPTNPIFRFFYKNIPYQDENELRAIFADASKPGLLNFKLNGLYHHKIEPNKLIEKIIIGPNSNDQINTYVTNMVADQNIKIKLSSTLKSIAWKLDPILEAYKKILGKHSVSNCLICKGNGYINKVLPNGSVCIKFCNECKIHEKWENQIKPELLNIVKQ